MVVLVGIRLMVFMVLFEVSLTLDLLGETPGKPLGVCDCKSEFKERGYIPKYAKGFKTTEVKVQYGEKYVTCGDSVPALQCVTAPTITFDFTEKCENATIMMIDPDAQPSPYLRWLAINVPSKVLQAGFKDGGTLSKLQGDDQQGDVVTDYELAKDYRTVVNIVFIYCQCQYNPDTLPLLETQRLGIDVQKYADDHGLKCPVVGTFFYMTSPADIKDLK